MLKLIVYSNIGARKRGDVERFKLSWCCDKLKQIENAVFLNV